MLPQLITEVPGPKSKAYAAELGRFESRNITYQDEGFPIFWERAMGTNVWDADGNRFLDLTAAFGVAGLGHTNSEILYALGLQAEQLFHAMGDVHPSPRKTDLCRELSAVTFERWGTGTGKSILCNSGFEAVEAALKTSLLYSGKAGVIAFSGAYHGLGYGALEVGGMPFFRNPFRAQLKDFAAIVPYPHCCHCPFEVCESYRLEGGDFPNCSTDCLEKIHDEIARTIRQREVGCIVVEPVQGRGGIIVPPRDFLPMLRRICDDHKILLVADEIFTGFNRTGALFACDHFKVVPDIICLGKALASGFPISACVGRADVMDAWPPSQGEALHTSTFLGNPVGCAMALASLKQHANPQKASRVLERGRRFKEALLELKSSRISHVRGVGLMCGIELATSSGEPDANKVFELMKQMLAKGLIVLGGGQQGNVLSFTPPFEISDEEIAFAASLLQQLIE